MQTLIIVLHGNYLIIKGEKGLSEIFNYLNVAGEIVDEVICYKRLKFDGL